jgi:hypothetical protein
VAPTDPLPVVRYDARASERTLDVMRWGLVPFWAKDIKVGSANINAKAEGIESKPAFRETTAWRSRKHLRNSWPSHGAFHRSRVRLPCRKTRKNAQRRSAVEAEHAHQSWEVKL